jgi:hypothetical protein
MIDKTSPSIAHALSHVRDGSTASAELLTFVWR